MKKMEKNLKKKESRAAELKAELFSLAEKHKEVHRLNNKLKDEVNKQCKYKLVQDSKPRLLITQEI